MYPHVIYSVEVCGKSNPTKHKSFRSLLDKCLKNLSSSRIDNPYIKINLLKFDQVYEIFLIRIYKFYVLGSGTYFKEIFCGNQTTHNYITGYASNHNFVHPLVQSSKMFISSFLNALKLWNDMPVLNKNDRFKTCLRHKFL